MIRRLVLACCLCSLATAASADPRLDRVEQWLKAVLQHEPGMDDRAARQVGAWTNDDLRILWIDANVLVQMMRSPRGLSFSVQQEGQRRPTPVRYTREQYERMRVLACAAAGTLTEPVCVGFNAANLLDPDLRRLAREAEDARRSGDNDNYILRRGALLHTDVGIGGPDLTEPIGAGRPSGLQAIRVAVTDGRGTGMGQSPLHWEIARLLLEFIIPAGETRPAPSRDGMVRRWYHAVAAWRQFREQHDTLHLDNAIRLFPDDADLLFLSGCHHETYASPLIQNAVRSMVIPSGFKLDVEPDRTELRLAEGFFRRALTARPDFAEARLRLGRVLLLRGQAPEASIELHRASESPGVSDDQPLLYYAYLLSGAAYEAIGRFDVARESFRKAAALYPAAQSPLLALSALARRRGDRAAALDALQQVFALQEIDPETDEPWWWYSVASARNADALLTGLRKPFVRRTEGAEGTEKK